MRIGFLQTHPRFGDVEGNLAAIETALGGVRNATVVLPELCTTGYLFASRAELWALAEPAGGPAAERLRALACRNRLVLCYGFAERDGRRVYNSAAAVTPGGRVRVYRKAHLFDREKLFFDVARPHFETYSAAGTRMGTMICFDWIFPEVCRSLALGGARLVLHPANLVLPYCQAAMTTRCIENRVFAVTCNRVGTETRAGATLRFTGGSQVVDPRGRVLVRAGSRDMELQLVAVDPEVAADKRITSRNDVLADRRPQAYRALVARHPVHR
jgi:predicted amidohydrolase